MGYKSGQNENVLLRFLKLSQTVQSSSVFYKMAEAALDSKSESLRTMGPEQRV